MRLTSPGFEHLSRELAPQVLGVIIRRYRNFAASEDAVQEALIAAAEQWPREGIPDNPRAWLTSVASRRMADQVRSDTARRRREAVVAMEEAGCVFPAMLRTATEWDEDDTLILIFMCCHPAFDQLLRNRSDSSRCWWLDDSGGGTFILSSGSHHGPANQPG